MRTDKSRVLARTFSFFFISVNSVSSVAKSFSLSTVAASLTLLSFNAAAQAPKLKQSVELGIEGRAFLQDAAYPEQEDSGVAVSMKPEWDLAIPRGNFRFAPFLRWDQHDDERTHGDIREFSFRQRFGNWDLLAGIGRVFWGTTESLHLVDIINQTDLVENPDGEEKLGQPMLNLAWTTPLGVFSGFVLPLHRERLLPGEKGRLRAPLRYDRGEPEYEDSLEEQHIDTALRWSLSRGALDIGLSHFHGTAREPRFEIRPDGAEPELVSIYDQIDRSGLDASLVSGGWLFKLETIREHSRVDTYAAAVGGFEYTIASAFQSSWDLGLLAEYLWDERGPYSVSPFQNDVFFGTRLAANDIAGTELLAGGIIDLDRDAWFGNLEASRRLGNNAKLVLEMRMFSGDDPSDPISAFRRDDYLQLEYIHYF